MAWRVLRLARDFDGSVGDATSFKMMNRGVLALFATVLSFVIHPTTASGAIEVAHSSNEFSCTQGMHNWYYGYYEGPYVSSNFRQMTQCVRDSYYPGDSWWVAQGQYWTSIRSAVSFPNGASSCGRQPVEHWAVRRWSSEITGVVTVTGTVHSALGAFDGFRAHVIVDGATVYSRLVSGAGSRSPVAYSATFTVAVGSTVDFAIQPNASDCNDHAVFTAVIHADAAPPPGGAPGAPSGLAATVVGSTVMLTWNAPTNGGAVTSYVVEAGRAPGDSSAVTSDTGSTSRTLTALSVAVGTYFVRVRARNSLGTSDPSNEVVILVGSGGGTCTTPPSAPAALTANVVGQVVTLQWNAPGGPLTAYVVEAGSFSGGSNIANVVTGRTDTSLTATATPGTYFVRIRARNACGTSSSSNEVLITVF